MGSSMPLSGAACSFICWRKKKCRALLLLLLLFIGLMATTPTLILADDPDPLACVTSLTTVEGCYNAVVKVASTKKFSKLGKPCCRAVTTISGSCWSILFPCQPYVPALLKAFCKFIIH